MRPALTGEISFQNVTFKYPGNSVPALDQVSFSVPAGSMLGVVGRSGSGKSTITRLLQGINRDYSGLVKIDGTDLREINLRHLRQQTFGDDSDALWRIHRHVFESRVEADCEICRDGPGRRCPD